MAIPPIIAPIRPVKPASGREWQYLWVGALLASLVQTLCSWAVHTPVWQRIYRRFIWWKPQMMQFQFGPGPAFGLNGTRLELLA
jgi:hypothetical protein